MGVVYRARDRKRNREIALKLLLSDRHHDDEGHERFKREARSLARLNHPGIVKVYDYGIHKGLPYLTMEFVPGKNLQSLLETNALRLLPGVDVLLKVAQAIDHAHSRGVVHRDLKPANVLIGSDNRPRISDFGLAKLDDGRITLTHDGDIVGTPLYMSPEQIQGALTQVGPSSDVWALGVMLYRVLTGSLPFNGTTVEEVSREVVNKTPVPPRTHVPDVPADLERVCLTALNKVPSQRYQSAGEFARDLVTYLQGGSVLAGRVTLAMRARRSYRALRIYAPTFLPGMVTVLILGLLAGWLAFPPSSAPPAANAAPQLETLLDRAEQAWSERAYDRLASLLNQAGAGPATADTRLAARLAALEARRTESLPELESALRTLERPDDALALATVAAAHGDLARLSLAAEALPADHPRSAWVAWLLDRGPPPPDAARLLGDPTLSADAADVPALERARAAIASGSFRLASASLAPLLTRGDLAAHVVQARLLLQRGLPAAARTRLEALPQQVLPPSLAHEASVLLALIQLDAELPEALAELAKAAPNRERELEAQRWAARVGAPVVPGDCPQGPPTLRLAWLRANVASHAGALQDLLVTAAAGATQDPPDLELADFPSTDRLGLPTQLHDPLLRAQVVMLRLGHVLEADLSGQSPLRNGQPARPDVSGVRAPLAAYLRRRVADPSGFADLTQAKEPSPGCDPWPLRVAEAALAAHGHERGLDSERADALLERAQRAASLALAMNPFHRRARLVSAHIGVRRCAGSFVTAAREQVPSEIGVAVLLWPQDSVAAAWAEIGVELFDSDAPTNAAHPDRLVELARRGSSGAFDPIDDGPRAAPAYGLAVDLALTNLAKHKGLSAALESYPTRVEERAVDESLNPEQRTRWEAVALALDPSRLDEALLAPARPALPTDEGGKASAVDRIARVLRNVTLAAQGKPLPDGWIPRARSDLDYARRRWPALGVEALSALVELADASCEPASWPDLLLEPWPGAVGDGLANGHAPGGALGEALQTLAQAD